MFLIPVPGHGAGLIDDKINNLAAFVDRAILGQHLWVGTGRQWDPEGLLSTFPAISTTLLGVWAGHILRNRETDEIRKTAELMVTGSLLIIIGYIWAWHFPIKQTHLEQLLCSYDRGTGYGRSGALLLVHRRERL